MAFFKTEFGLLSFTISWQPWCVCVCVKASLEFGCVCVCSKYFVCVTDLCILNRDTISHLSIFFSGEATAFGLLITTWQSFFFQQTFSPQKICDFRFCDHCAMLKILPRRALLCVTCKSAYVVMYFVWFGLEGGVGGWLNEIRF